MTFTSFLYTDEQQARLKILLARFTLTNIKAARSQDGGSLFAKVFFDGKLIDAYRDDGVGGGSEPMNFTSEGGQAYLEFLKDGELTDLVHRTYSFLKREDLNEFHVIDFIVNTLFNEINSEKTRKAMHKKSENVLVWRPNSKVQGHEAYGSAPFSKCKTFDDVLKYRNGLELLQKTYDGIVEKLTKSGGGIILTPAELLTKKGVKVNPAFHSAS